MNNVSQVAMVQMEIEKNGRKYQFYMPIGSTYGEAYDVAFDILNQIKEMINTASQRPEAPKDVEPKTEIPN